MKLRARLGLVLLALAVAGGLAWGFLPRPLAVEVVPAVRAPFRVTVEEEGRTRVRERYVIAAPVAGELRRITLKAGDAVEAGQVLAWIDASAAGALDPRARAQATARLRAAEAALAAAAEHARAATAQAELAEDHLRRARKLQAAGFLSSQALEQAESEARRAGALRRAAEHAVAVARFDRDTARAALTESTERKSVGFAVRAPAAGRVLRVVRESAGPVQAGQPLLEVGDPRDLEVEVDVLSTQAVQIRPGTPVEFERWGGPPLSGRVRVVEPTGFTKVSALGVEEQRVRVIADFASPPDAWQGLGDGYRVEARFVVWEGRDVLQIPASSLVRSDGGWAVFRLAEGRARLTPVGIGRRAGLVVQVTSGLAPGDLVVNHPDDRVAEGSRIAPRKPDTRSR